MKNNSSSNRLRALREEAELSLEELAAQIGVTNQQVSLLELGKRKLTVEWLQKLASVLSCHPWAIVEADDEERTRTSGERELLSAFRTLDATRKQTALREVTKLASTAARLRKSGR